MGRQLSPTTIVKNAMQAYINQYNLEKRTDITQEDGTRIYIMPPNRFGPGYVTINLPESSNTPGWWSADFSSKTKGKLMKPGKSAPLTCAQPIIF